MKSAVGNGVEGNGGDPPRRNARGQELLRNHPAQVEEVVTRAAGGGKAATLMGKCVIDLLPYLVGWRIESGTGADPGSQGGGSCPVALTKGGNRRSRGACDTAAPAAVDRSDRSLHGCENQKRAAVGYREQKAKAAAAGYEDIRLPGKPVANRSPALRCGGQSEAPRAADVTDPGTVYLALGDKPFRRRSEASRKEKPVLQDPGLRVSGGGGEGEAKGAAEFSAVCQNNARPHRGGVKEGNVIEDFAKPCCSVSLVLAAAVAQAKDFHPLSIDLESGLVLNVLDEFLVEGVGNIDIDYPPAGFADKVEVRLDLRLVPVKGASKVEPFYQSLLYEDVEITIDVTEGEARKLPFELVVNRIGRGVATCVLKQGENTVSLLALAKLFFRHGTPIGRVYR